MDHRVRLLFREVADLPQAERDRVFTTRGVSPEVRAEIESLLGFDLDEEHAFTGCVAQAAESALRSSQPEQPVACGPYRLVRLIGEGGMGSVYLAERSDGEIQQRVAIKLLHAGTGRASWQERFLRERQLLAYLNHPSVTRLLDAGRTADGRPYLVMEYVEGVPIDIWAGSRTLREQLTLFVRVCEGVAHAHSHLIIHRDLKPSNILVDEAGLPKLLDFGIAKLLDETVEQTRTVERLLTPAYASPEQLRGTLQTTATDVYSLGAVLYRLLTGRSPHESEQHAWKAVEVAAGRQEIPAASRLNPDLPSDIDCILRKALRAEPDGRYISVEAFANDIRAFLESRPVEARSGDAWYRTRKFLRRYWVPVAAAAMVMASLAGGLYVADSQRRLAEQRFGQLRQLSKKVFDLDAAIQNLPGSIPARKSLVSASLEYLRGLAFDPAKDPDLAQEVGEAYWHVGQIQGVPTVLNLGQAAEAEQNLKRAEALMDVVVARRPKNRDALLNSMELAQDRMILAESDHKHPEAIARARKAAERADLFMENSSLKPSEIHRCAVVFGNIALAYTNMHLYAQAVPLARRSVDLERTLPTSSDIVGQGLSLLANALRFEGDLDGSLKAITDARKFSEQAIYANPVKRMINLYGILLREGLILGEKDGINLNRPGEAIDSLQAALDLTEDSARADPNDSTSRTRVGTAARELGPILSERDPQRALAVFDLGIRRLHEIPNNLKARRDEANVLAESSYVLRALHRDTEAKQRIDTALDILRATKDYPTPRLELDSDTYTVVRALGDYYASQGDLMQARQTYEQFLDQVMAAQPEPLADLRQAPRLSIIYERLAAIYTQTGDADKANTLEARRQDLWRHWASKLPDNAYVRRQLAAAESATLRQVRKPGHE